MRCLLPLFAVFGPQTQEVENYLECITLDEVAGSNEVVLGGGGAKSRLFLC